MTVPGRAETPSGWLGACLYSDIRVQPAYPCERSVRVKCTWVILFIENVNYFRESFRENRNTIICLRNIFANTVAVGRCSQKCLRKRKCAEN
jgi:hypothetical protein